MKKEIRTEDDIRLLVDSFYAKVNEDKLIGPIFNIQAAVHWDEHLPKMYAFWGTQLIGTASYNGRPFPPHMRFDLKAEHFNRWLDLFMQTVDEHFTGITAEMARQKARNIANVFQYKLGILKID